MKPAASSLLTMGLGATALTESCPDPVTVTLFPTAYHSGINWLGGPPPKWETIATETMTLTSIAYSTITETSYVTNTATSTALVTSTVCGDPQPPPASTTSEDIGTNTATTKTTILLMVSATTSSYESADPVTSSTVYVPIESATSSTGSVPTDVTAASPSSVTTAGATPTPVPSAGPDTTSINGTFPESRCNTADDRSKWCYDMDINTDYESTWPTTGHICAYDLVITNTTWDYDGTPRLALAVNGQVPGPAVECDWGDTVRINVTNLMQDNGTSIHWHGVRQLGTNPNDGVNGVTECALAPGSSRIYEWQATSYGSSWYHSHFLTQYADGVRGPIIIHGPASANYDVDMGAVMVDDLFNDTAAAEYSIIAHTGPLDAANYLLNGKNTKPDLSAGEAQTWDLEPGKRYLFRMVNSAAQNMWKMHFDNHQMQVIAADFVPITPYYTDWLAIGIGQRFDVIVTADQPVDSYFFRAVTQTACPANTDNTGLGDANGIIRYVGAPDTLPTSTAGNKTIADFATCEDEPIVSLQPIVTKSVDSGSFTAQATTLPVGLPGAVATTDDGSVFRWYLNGNSMNVDWANPTLQKLAAAAAPAGADSGNTSSSPALDSTALVLPQANQWVYFVIQNEFLAAHPMHLHGHDFALLGQGLGIFDAANMTSMLNFARPPRRDTAMLPGGGWTVIAFWTDNPGVWLMHCHIVWHVEGGLALQFLERPAEIPARSWAGAQPFQDECNAWDAYVAAGVPYPLLGSESGLKNKARRSEEDSSSLSLSSPDVKFKRSSAGSHHDYHHKRRSGGSGGGSGGLKKNHRKTRAAAHGGLKAHH